MIITNVKVFGSDCRFHEGQVGIEDGRIRAQASGEEFDGKGWYAVPGLVDIHFHGCVGHDFCDGTEESIQALADYELSCGVTSITPATMTLDEETLTRVCLAAAAHKNNRGARLIGINMEGPFISREKKGAQNEAFVRRPDAHMFERLNEASGGMIRQVALAPETEGAMEFVRRVREKTVVSIAHTVSDYDTAMEAIRQGVTHVTHLYNAMPPYSHRAPGVVGAAADSPGVFVELICDGVHIHPAAIRTTFKIFTDERICLISDSMEATGMEDGEYALGGQAVFKKGNRATLKDGTIAGSATNLMDCVRTAVGMGIPLESAIRCATVNPAKSIGVFDRYGSLEEGKCADVVLLDEKLNLKAVFLDGKLVSGGSCLGARNQR